VEALLAAADRTAGFVGPELLTRAATHARDTGRTGLRERALMAMQQIVDPASVGWTHRRRRVSACPTNSPPPRTHIDQGADLATVLWPTATDPHPATSDAHKPPGECCASTGFA